MSLRISLSAQQLTNPSFVVSNTYILVQVKYLTWFDFHRTEVRRSTDPDFKESAVFNVCSPDFHGALETRSNHPFTPAIAAVGTALATDLSAAAVVFGFPHTPHSSTTR